MACSLLAISGVYFCLNLQGAVYWYVLLHLNHLRRLYQQLEVGVLFCRKCSRGWDQDAHIAARCSEGGSIAGFLMSPFFALKIGRNSSYLKYSTYIDICYSMQLSLAFLLHIWEVPASNFGLEVTSCHWFFSGLLANGWSTWYCIVSAFFHFLSSLLLKRPFHAISFHMLAASLINDN